MGLTSRPGRVDSFFAHATVSDQDQPAGQSNLALICQSGAFAVAREMKLVTGIPVYNITVGNQMDLTIGDFANFLAEDGQVGVIGIYAEGFNCPGRSASLPGHPQGRAGRKGSGGLQGRTDARRASWPPAATPPPWPETTPSVCPA